MSGIPRRLSILICCIFLSVHVCQGISFSRFPAGLGFPQTNISGIAQDTEGDIWITSADGGVYRYDGHKIELEGDEIKATGVFSDSCGRVFVGTKRSIYEFDRAQGLTLLSGEAGFRLAEETPAGDIFFLFYDILTVLRKGSDTLEVVYEASDNPHFNSMEYMDGYIYFGDASGGLFRVGVTSPVVEKVASFSSDIKSLVRQDDDLLWVSESGRGVSCFSISKGLAVRTINKGDGLISNNIQSMCFENDSTLWLGSYDGLTVLDIKGGSATSAQYIQYDDSSLAHNSVKVLFLDRQGGIWIGTYFGGVCYYHKSRNRFKVLCEGIGPEHLNSNVVSCISEAPDGTLWLGTNNGGINVYDKNNGTFSFYNFNSVDESSANGSNDVKAFHFLPDGRHVLVGLFRGGLNRLDCRTGQIRRLDSPGDVISIVPEDDDHLILHSYSDSYSYCISTGEYKAKGRSNDFPKFHNSPVIPRLKIASELPYGEDVVWYATDNGLYRFVKHDSTLVHYSMAGGLACDYYNPGAACLSRDGVMYFGGVGGVTYFDPSQFAVEDICPKPMLRSITINGNNHVEPSMTGIRLKSKQNHLSFNFSVPDYISVRSNTFKYKLEGFDKDWNGPYDSYSAVYPNLPAGVYHFRLQASRGNVEWTECGYAQRIKIFRPWYSSIAGLIIEISLALLLLYLVWRSVTRRREMENALAMKNIEEEYKREISKLKALKLVNTELRIDQKAKPVRGELSRQDELFITKAMSIVEANLSNEAFSTEVLAEKLGISRVSLHNKIKQATGMSALDFIHKIRFSEACRLLEEGELRISEIGYRIGIKNPSYFSTSFKKAVGITPKEYFDKQNQK